MLIKRILFVGVTIIGSGWTPRTLADDAGKGAKTASSNRGSQEQLGKDIRFGIGPGNGSGK